jgi:hypothetical protein
LTLFRAVKSETGQKDRRDDVGAAATGALGQGLFIALTCNA